MSKVVIRRDIKIKPPHQAILKSFSIARAVYVLEILICSCRFITFRFTVDRL